MMRRVPIAVILIFMMALFGLYVISKHAFLEPTELQRDIIHNKISLATISEGQKKVIENHLFDRDADGIYEFATSEELVETGTVSIDLQEHHLGKLNPKTGSFESNRFLMKLILDETHEKAWCAVVWPLAARKDASAVLLLMQRDELIPKYFVSRSTFYGYDNQPEPSTIFPNAKEWGELNSMWETLE